jgi:hypothetical protein
MDASEKRKSVEVRIEWRSLHKLYYFKRTSPMRIKWVGNVACLKCMTNMQTKRKTALPPFFAFTFYKYFIKTVQEIIVTDSNPSLLF